MRSKDTVVDDPRIRELSRWLVEEWDGPFEFLRVDVERHETADGSEEAWYIFPLIDEGPDADPDPDALSAVDIAVRDKALELGLDYPWFVFVRGTDEDEPMEDDSGDLTD